MLINFETIVNKLDRQMDTSVVQSKLIASNIANVDTPAYKAKELQFDEVLNSEMDGLQMKLTHPGHMTDSPAGLPGNHIVENPNPGRPDGNNVNIDEEMLKLTKNNVKYNVSVQLLAKRLRTLKDAIEKSK